MQDVKLRKMVNGDANTKVLKLSQDIRRERELN
jgi:hypothetical protein